MSSAQSESAPSLDPERWRKIGEILSAVIELPLLQREQAVLGLCDGDRRLADEVGRYLVAHEQSSRWLDGAVSPLAQEEPTMAPGQTIGSYQVVRELGKGGMGEVYLAQRADEAYERQVAIKVIKRGLDSQEIVRRFFRERRILANLDHPSIARLIDGGSAEDGRPYFVMEFIDGQRIDEFVQKEALSVRARLEIFRKVCAAVSHAHRQLVVHRDLKPANILVDSRGEPKLLDFGIAKLLASESELVETRTALRPMTLKYSSPEQLRGGVITAAVDIHALGLLLYELLTGSHPYGSESPNPEHLKQLICHFKPIPPSRVAPQSSGGRISRQLKGDIDAIVLKSLDKDPLLRYPSVANLDEDLRRHLEGEAIRAKKGSTWYRFSKFARRHWQGLSIAVAVLALIWFFVLSTIRQSEEVAKSAETARRTADFMVELFSIVDPSEARGQEITAREILDRGVERIENDLSDEPQIRAVLTQTMAEVYGALGLYGASTELYENAVLATRAAYGDKHPELIYPLLKSAVIYKNRGELERAEQQAREGFQLAEHLYGDKHETVAQALNALALVHRARGELDSAEALSRRSLTIGRDLADGILTGQALNTLGVVLVAQGRYAEAEVSYRESTAHASSLFDGEHHPALLTSQNNLATVLIRQGKGAEAEPLLRQVVEGRRLILSEDHPDLGTSLNNLAMLLHRLERNDEAEPVIQEALDIYRRGLGEEHPGVTMALLNLALIRQAKGQLEEAGGLFLEAEKRHRKDSQAGDPQFALALSSRASLLMQQGDDVSAEALLREALQIYARSVPPSGGWRYPNTKSRLGECLTRLRRYEESERLLLESLPALEAQTGLDPIVVRTLRRLAELYEAWDKPEKERAYRERLAES